jgi:hypothetical protein
MVEAAAAKWHPLAVNNLYSGAVSLLPRQRDAHACKTIHGSLHFLQKLMLITISDVT